MTMTEVNQIVLPESQLKDLVNLSLSISSNRPNPISPSRYALHNTSANLASWLHLDLEWKLLIAPIFVPAGPLLTSARQLF